MRAVVMRSFGDPSVLALEDVADPGPARGEALFRVGAVAVARTRDVATRTGTHPFSRQVSLPHVLGGDFAGVVEAAGAEVDPSIVGQRVAVQSTHSCGWCPACRAGLEPQCASLEMLGIHRWGAYAELVSAPAANINPIPAAVPMVEAAAMAANGPIAFAQLEAGKVTAGTWVLVTGATGALATVVAALAHQRGARVIGLSRRPAAIPSGLHLTARVAVDSDDLPGTLMELTEGAGVATVIDNVADGDLFSRYWPALAIGSRVVTSGAIGDPSRSVLAVPASSLYFRSQSLLGMRTATPRDASSFWSAVAEGFRLPPGLIEELPLDAAAAAHARIESGKNVAHTVLSVGS
jgi:D-arabinose 1-dehydrogenase-like Zn-dependent alcohol dehydrogenase